MVEAWDRGADSIQRTLRRSKTARGITPGRRLGMQYEDLTLHTNDGVTLKGWWVTPEQPRADGLVVVMHHHYGGQKATMLPWIHLFWRLGIPSISFDARGHADSEPAPIGRGSFPKRTADLRAALAEARRRGAKRILGFGQSQGAAVLAMALGTETRDLAGVVFDSGPAPDMVSAAWGLAGNLLGKHKDDRLARALLASRILPGTEPHIYGPKLWRNLARLRSVPVLWLHGDRDEVIPRRSSRLWYRSLSPGAPWQELEVPRADHVRTLQTAPSLVEERVGNFIASLAS